jgi:sugar phosphate permease
MTKQSLDRVGGIGSILTGGMCVWFANQHHRWESMFTVWVVMAVLLALNGILMLVHASRSGGLPEVARELLKPRPADAVEHKARG